MSLNLGQAIDVLLAATLAPLGLALSFFIVHMLARAWRVSYFRRPIPVLVHPLNFEHHKPEFVQGQDSAMLQLPSLLRDYLAADSVSLVNLAPGPMTNVTPQLLTATADESAPTSWAARLVTAFQSRYRPFYAIILVPEVPQQGFSVGVQIVREPQRTLVSARSFHARELLELSYVIGGFCAESILEQPGFLRRSPRWEHWKNGAYTFLRSGLYYQKQGKWDKAHAYYTEAAKRCPGNVRVALVHGNLHEKQEEFEKAATVYNAAACLWTQNIDLSYRLAATKVNLALSSDLDRHEKIALVKSANEVLLQAQRRLLRRSIVKSLLRVSKPWARDRGERIYWYSWFRADSYRKPLRFLRKSKRHEYRCALHVAVETNNVYLFKLQGGASKLRARAAVQRSWKKVLQITHARRSGWLAHWTAACFFSRAAILPPGWQPRKRVWSREWRAVQTSSYALGLRLSEAAAPPDWKTYCQERAVGEIGRVVRNPTSQFDARVLQDDPDMKPLQHAFKGQAVAVLAGVVGTAGGKQLELDF